jgi:PAS domain S-box-containing protein
MKPVASEDPSDPNPTRLTAAPGDLLWEETFDAVPALISIIDTNCTIIRVNRAMAEYCGAPSEELIGRRCHEVMHREPDRVSGCPHASAIGDGLAHTVQMHENWFQRSFEVTVTPVRDSQGELSRFVHVARDVTAKVLTETYRKMGQQILLALSEGESQMETMQRVISVIKGATGIDAVGIRLEDQEDFNYFCQEGFSDDFLRKEKSLISRNREGEICRDEYGNICLECNCGLVVTGKTDPSAPGFTRGGSFWTNDSSTLLHLLPQEERRHNPRNECVHEGFASIAVIPILAKGGTVGLLQLNDRRKHCFTVEAIETLEDIGKNIGEAMLRKQAEEKLVSTARFLKTLTDQLPGLVGYWGSDLRCSFANSAYERWFGISKEAMIGITAVEFLGEELFAAHECYIRGALAGEPQGFEENFIRTDGQTTCTWTQFIPDVVDGATKGFFVLASDITELKLGQEERNRLESQLQQAQKMESVGRLAGGVAHDFNNMLGVILGHAELAIVKEQSSAPLNHDLVQIREAAQRSANLTRQLLAFARKQTISPKVLDLNETVSGMLKMLQRLLREDIDLTWQPAAGLWQVKADPSQLDQILANLCVNARDAIASTGRITIKTRNSIIDAQYCKTHPDAVPGEYVRLEVTDDGCGMDGETLGKIFEPFYTTKEVGKGTGLGLATVFGIVKQNNGCIDVDSLPGKGSTFAIHLPRHASGSEASSAETGGLSPCCGNETILLVEDEQMILDMAKAMLEHHGYSVLTAGTPREAVEVARRHGGRIDLLLTDVIMPLMNGSELAKTLMASYREMRCLFMSGYTADAIAQHGVLDDKVHFIQKPFTVPELAAAVRKALD